jgi:hypothetical protein
MSKRARRLRPKGMTHSSTAHVRSSALLWPRRALSVFVGLMTIVVLSSLTDFVLESTGVIPSGPLFDTNLLLLATAYRIAFSVLGCYLAARLAPDNAMRHALALGVIGVLFSIVGAIVNAWMNLGPAWYALLLVAVALPCAYVGGKVGSDR